MNKQTLTAEEALDKLFLDIPNGLIKGASDYYMDNIHVIKRLTEDWEKHGKIVIAYDYDNTVKDYHNNGLEFHNVISLLRDCREIGAYFVVYTARDESMYDEIMADLKARDIPVDAINQNAPFVKFIKEESSRKWWMFWKKPSIQKIYYNILLDDRAGLLSAYSALFFACMNMKQQKGK